MTALEVGIKHYISACVPAATWLAQEAPSPPVEKILREYVPMLVPPGRAEPVEIGAEILEELKKAVPIRNGLAHKGADVPRQRLMKTLRAVRNTLWAFDEALGQGWATEHRFQSLDEDLRTGYKRV